MIQAFVNSFMERKDELAAKFQENHPVNYLEIVKNVISILGKDEDAQPDGERIHEIDDGEYQGTLVFVIAETGYQPSVYWYVMVGYGSCSGCDTLEGIRRYDSGTPTKQQVDDYMTLALHIVQQLKRMDDEEVY